MKIVDLKNTAAIPPMTGGVIANGAEAAPVPAAELPGGGIVAGPDRKKPASAQKPIAATPTIGEEATEHRTDGKVDASAAAAKPVSGASKTEIVLKKLRSAKGATVTALMEATGWQAHSVRGFLSGTVRKKLGLGLASEVGKDGARRYRIEMPAKAQ
ncbi:DUF3489 domain-containing protein [Mesorhizobium sp. IMUNJ 23232]|uniref:DUF3489 domain-containing protein n=1 Tax=Mesorhizobium sp. IMUNJ 23232 TaxID=3376064 RepID=UPI003799D195